VSTQDFDFGPCHDTLFVSSIFIMILSTLAFLGLFALTIGCCVFDDLVENYYLGFTRRMFCWPCGR
jgi:hypothetical protein